MEAHMLSYFLTFILLTLLSGSVCLNCHTALQTFETGHILPTGHLNASGLSIPKGHYDLHNGTHFRACVCSAINCIRKCCPLGHSFGEDRACVNHNNTVVLDIGVHDINYKWLHNQPEKTLRLVYGDTCAQKYRLDPEEYPDESYLLLENGELHLPNRSSGFSKLHLQDFCVEAILSSDGTAKGHVVLACFVETAVDSGSTAFPVGMLISIPFLLLTLAVYCYLPELRNSHGKSLMCHVSSLTVGYIFLAALNLSGNTPNEWFCIFSGPVIQFSFLATFFWLNVMSFDIWWAFSGCKGFGGNVRERELKTFVTYSLYAWGGPTIMLLVTMAIQLSPNIPDYVIRPGFTETSCWFSGRASALAYFYGPVSVLLLCNIFLFIATAYKIFIVKRQTRVLESEDSRKTSENNKQRFFLYLKLFLVMGVNWSLEVISWAVKGPYYIWFISDICNCLQGIFIFIIFVSKTRIRKLLLARWKLAETEVHTTTSTFRSSRNSSTMTMTVIQHPDR